MDALPRLLLTNAAAAGLLALLAWAASRTVRRQAVVHGLWLLALVKLVTPPIAPLPVIPAAWRLPELSLAPSAPTVATMPTATAQPGDPLPRLPDRTSPPVASARPTPVVDRPAAVSGGVGAILALGLGALAVTLLAAWRFARFSRLLACARPAPPGLAGRTGALASAIGLRSSPPVLLVPARIPPVLWPAPGGPRLLLPEGLLGDLHEEELDALVAHELAHLRRRDHWVRLVELAATALFWWYPVTWWARTALRRAEERCCDEWVLRVLPRSAAAYANGLLKSLTFLAGRPAPLPTVASGAGPVRDLEARLKEILMTRPAPRLAVPLRLALAAAAALGLAAFPTHARPVEGQEAAPATPAVAPAAAPAPVASVAATPAVAPVAAAAPQAAPAPAKARTATAPVVASSDAKRALEDERRALEEARRQLHQKEIELARKQVELEAKAQQAELQAAAAELRTRGLAEEAARLERELELVARRAELQTRQLGLEAEHMALEKQLEAKILQEKKREELEWKQQQLELKMKQMQLQASEPELRMKEMQQTAEDAEAQLEHEIQRLQAALDALRAKSAAKPTPRPEP
jgi:beta-lactamase regulating signal transducer with metallopeptidase domain